MKIDVQLKRKCVDAYNNGESTKKIFTDIFQINHPYMSYNCFRQRLKDWRNKRFADDMTLSCGTYPNFTAHDTTVQVNGKGDIVQAWIKSSADTNERYNELIEAIKEYTEPIIIEESSVPSDERMLEIAFFDMHFGLPNDYSTVLSETNEIIRNNRYSEINIIIGQDMFHNDDFRGRTSKGTAIEKIDVVGAWNTAKEFWKSVIFTAFMNCNNVHVLYVKGNHDESMTWAFVQMLKAMFPNLIVDDSLNKRKSISWNGCFVGLTHGDEIKSSPNDLRGQFTIGFPTEFANSTVREIHCGHLHHEKESDLYGVMIRRLSTANITDEWSDNGGYIGSHKRFMMFEWVPNKLKSIYYIGG